MDVDARMMRAVLLVLAMTLAGCAADAPPAARPTLPMTPTPATTDGPDPTTGPLPAIMLHPFLDGFSSPLLLTHNGTPGEVFIVEQGGRIWRVVEGDRSLWLDVANETVHAGERGLLGLAFDPADGRAYISYTDLAGDSNLVRVHADGERELLLLVDQPYSNHNGGHLAFGPDGFLYYGLGDGGSAGDPQGHGQDPSTRLGSILRLDVSGARGYRPAEGNAWGDVWAMGLRNPWRFSFDRATGDLFIGDVGQNKIEEIDHLPAGSPAGANFGWNAYEGSERYSLLGQTFSDPIFPIAEYTHDDGCSVTGGFVYRGEAEPALDGIYYLADYCSGKIWGLRQVDDEWRLVELLHTTHRITSFGEDAEGELYVVDHAGDVLRLSRVPDAAPQAPAVT